MGLLGRRILAAAIRVGKPSAGAGGGWTHVEPLARQSLGGGGAIESGETFARSLGGARVEAVFRRRGPIFGFGVDASGEGSLGATGGSSWRQARGWVIALSGT